MKTKVFLADLTHTEAGIAALTFPLGTAFVASYAQSTLGGDFEFSLFKFPEELAKAIADDPPKILACANYSWNLELAYKLSTWARRQNPDMIVIFGGPNFPVLPQEKIEFLNNRSTVDFHIENEGEIGFANLLEKLRDFDFNVAELKNTHDQIVNCSYLAGQELIFGGIRRIPDVNIIPSPYLNGMLDPFFDFPLVPMIETTRGCPFSCSFCADGLASKNKVERYDDQRVKDELWYIADHIKNVDELIITDLNFGMYKQDTNTAQHIANIQSERHWPVLVKGSAGKNRPERIIAAASLLKGSWVIGSAIQSSDPEVLKNIKRSNISVEAYRDFQEVMTDLDEEALTYTEIILALPGDTKEKHFESLRYGVENRAKSLSMFQAMLLSGTEMATQETRDKFQLLTRFRIIPGSVGVYRFGEEKVPVAEIEEIIVGSKDMTFDDYVSCRVMHLLIETYHNNALFEELFAALRAMELSEFDFLVYLHAHEEFYTAKLREVLSSFVKATAEDLYISREEAEESALHPDLIGRYLSGELGSNELLSHRGLLYLDLEDTLSVLIRSLKAYLAEQSMLTDSAERYLDQLGDFILCKKRDIQETDLALEQGFKYDFNAIAELNFEIDPRYAASTSEDTRLRFFHTPAQQEHIQNAVKLYSNHTGGIGRMLQRNNLRRMYRQFEPILPAEKRK